MIQLIFNNFLINYIGWTIRYLILKSFDSSIKYRTVLYGKHCPKSKDDEIFNFNNELKNRFVGILFIIFIIILALTI